MEEKGNKLAKELLEAVKTYSETDDVDKLRQWMVKSVDHKLAKCTKKISELEFARENSAI